MLTLKHVLVVLSLVVISLGSEKATSFTHGVNYPYEQMRQWQKYPTTVNKPCNPYDKKGCPNFIIKKSAPH